MTAPGIVIPFKAKGRKSRLSRVLTAAERRIFAETMLLDVLAAVRSAGLLSTCFVVSSAHGVLSLAEESGATGLAEPSDQGVNSAVGWAVAKLREVDEFMVVPADLPILRGQDIRNALSLGSLVDRVISPSKSFDGTNLFLFSGKDAVTFSYDSNSFWNHVGGTARGGLSLAVYCGKGVLFDVDSAEDFRALADVRINTPSVAFAKKALAR